MTKIKTPAPESQLSPEHQALAIRLGTEWGERRFKEDHSWPAFFCKEAEDLLGEEFSGSIQREIVQLIRSSAISHLQKLNNAAHTWPWKKSSAQTLAQIGLPDMAS